MYCYAYSFELIIRLEKNWLNTHLQRFRRTDAGLYEPRYGP